MSIKTEFDFSCKSTASTLAVRVRVSERRASEDFQRTFVKLCKDSFLKTNGSQKLRLNKSQSIRICLQAFIVKKPHKCVQNYIGVVN